MARMPQMSLILLNAKDRARLFIRGIRPIRTIRDISLRSAFPVSNRSIEACLVRTHRQGQEGTGEDGDTEIRRYASLAS